MESVTKESLIKELNLVQSELKRLRKKESDLESAIEKLKTNYDRYKNTRSYDRLTSNHSLSEYGVWEVYGEDPNCDLAGSHTQPFLGLYEGELDKVIRKAVDISGFWAWGAGGDIRKHIPKKVTKV